MKRHNVVTHEREKIIAQGQAEIEAERNRAKEDLRKQVAAPSCCWCRTYS